MLDHMTPRPESLGDRQEDAIALALIRKPEDGPLLCQPLQNWSQRARQRVSLMARYAGCRSTPVGSATKCPACLGGCGLRGPRVYRCASAPGGRLPSEKVPCCTRLREGRRPARPWGPRRRASAEARRPGWSNRSCRSGVTSITSERWGGQGPTRYRWVTGSLRCSAAASVGV